MELKPTVISTFAGCGGSTLGYQWAGFNELLAIEWDAVAAKTFALNFPNIPIWQRDIREVNVNEIFDFTGLDVGGLDMLDGSPPCQGFSTAGKREVQDDRNDLFREFIRLIEGLQPRVFVMENVKGMVLGKMRGRFIEIITRLKDTGYRVKCKLMNSMYYGVPQSRQRLIFIGVRPDLDREPSFPEPHTNIFTVADAISDLSDEMDETRDHIWIDESPSGRNTKTWHLAHAVKPGEIYAGQKRKSKWNEPAPTLTTGGIISKPYLRGMVCHPNFTRTFSLLEFKRLSSFPDDFQFMGFDGFKRIGNAVMPKMAQAIAENIKRKLL